MNSTLVAHVAEAILFFDGTLSYDTAWQRAADLLAAYPGLVMAADSYSQGSIGTEPFYRRVRAILQDSQRLTSGQTPDEAYASEQADYQQADYEPGE